MMLIICCFECLLTPKRVWWRPHIRLVMSHVQQLNPTVWTVDRLMGQDIHLRKHIQVCYLDSVECNLTIKSNFYSCQRDFYWRPHRLPLEIFLSTWAVFGQYVGLWLLSSRHVSRHGWCYQCIGLSELFCGFVEISHRWYGC